MLRRNHRRQIVVSYSEYCERVNWFCYFWFMNIDEAALDKAITTVWHEQEADMIAERF